MAKKEVKKKFPSKFNTTLEIHCPKRQGDFICEQCLNEIKKGERIIVLGTYDVNEILKEKKKVKFVNAGFVSEYFYHVPCWKQFFNQSINECVQNMQKQLLNNSAIKQAMQLAGGLLAK